MIKEVTGERILQLVFWGPPSPERSDFGVSLSATVSDEEVEILADAYEADLVGEDDEKEKFPDG